MTALSIILIITLAIFGVWAMHSSLSHQKIEGFLFLKKDLLRESFTLLAIYVGLALLFSFCGGLGVKGTELRITTVIIGALVWLKPWASYREAAKRLKGTPDF